MHVTHTRELSFYMAFLLVRNMCVSSTRLVYAQECLLSFVHLFLPTAAHDAQPYVPTHYINAYYEETLLMGDVFYL